MKILISGDGAMGQAVLQMAQQTGIEVVATVGQKLSSSVAFASQVKQKVDCVVDFSCNELLAEVVEYCFATCTPLVTGTTNLSESVKERLQELSKRVAVCQSNNFSVGVAVLMHLVDDALKKLNGLDFDVEVTEKHHNEKLDCPSGTAKDVLQRIAKAKPNAEFAFGRYGVGKRKNNEVGVFCVRGGGVTGVHEIAFFGKRESLVLSHTAQEKGVFAQGALDVAKKIVGLPKGQYAFEYFLG